MGDRGEGRGMKWCMNDIVYAYTVIKSLEGMFWKGSDEIVHGKILQSYDFIRNYKVLG